MRSIWVVARWEKKKMLNSLECWIDYIHVCRFVCGFELMSCMFDHAVVECNDVIRSVSIATRIRNCDPCPVCATQQRANHSIRIKTFNIGDHDHDFIRLHRNKLHIFFLFYFDGDERNQSSSSIVIVNETKTHSSSNFMHNELTFFHSATRFGCHLIFPPLLHVNIYDTNSRLE